jgi:thiamine-monophosphate kinase
MRLSELGEFGLIERIRKTTPKGPGVRIGIGDDAAWLECKNRSFLITSDLLIEGIHFDLRWTSFYELGYKTLAVNVSDIAAMGGRPTYLTISMGIPVNSSTKKVEDFFRGIRALGSQTGVTLVGGDTSAARLVFVSASLIGQAPFGAITRAGAKEGDDIYVTGTLGDAALGLEILKKNQKVKKWDRAFLISRHLFPSARLKAGLILAKERLARAMIDVSDGLLQDLGQLCKASKVGAVVWSEALPLSRAYHSSMSKNGPVHALCGGEDYELLFCLRSRDRARLEKVKKRLGVRITCIGKCVPSRHGIRVITSKGKSLPVPLMGYDHFKSKFPVLTS